MSLSPVLESKPNTAVTKVTTKNTATAYIALLVNNLITFFISSSYEAITAFDKSNIPYKISNIGTPI